jgi:hypothetical protein
MPVHRSRTVVRGLVAAVYLAAVHGAEAAETGDFDGRALKPCTRLGSNA